MSAHGARTVPHRGVARKGTVGVCLPLSEKFDPLELSSTETRSNGMGVAHHLWEPRKTPIYGGRNGGMIRHFVGDHGLGI